MSLTKVDVSIETDQNCVFGEARVKIIDLVADWVFYPDKKKKIDIQYMAMDGGVPIHLDEDDALFKDIVSQITDAVTAFLGRADIAAEEAKDEATDMAIDQMIEEKYGTKESR